MATRGSILGLLAAVGAVLLIWGGATTSRAGNKQRPCDPRIRLCPKATPTPRPTPSRTPGKTPVPPPVAAGPKSREAKPVVLKFNELTTGKLDPAAQATGVSRQPNKRLSLFNEYQLEAVKSDLFVIQLEAEAEPTSVVQVGILDKAGKEVAVKHVTVRPGEIEIRTPSGQLPGDGPYRVRVLCPNLPARPSAIPYKIIAARITPISAAPISAAKVEEGSISRQSSRWTPAAGPGKGVTLYNEYVLSVGSQNPLVFQLQAAQPQLFKLSLVEWENRAEVNGRQPAEHGGELRFNAPGAAPLKEGKYSLLVQHVTPQSPGAATPYALLLTKFDPLAVGAEVKGQIFKSPSTAAPGSARGGYAYWDDYPLSVAKSEPFNINLQPGGFDVQIIDEKGRPLPLSARDAQTGEIDLATEDGSLRTEGKYYLRVSPSPSPGVTATPLAYTLKLNPASLTAERYQAAVKKIRDEFDRTKDFEGAVKRLQRLIRFNPKEPQAFEALGRLYFEQQNFALAQKNLAEAIQRGAEFSFEVIHNEKWENIEIKDDGGVKWKNRRRSSFKLRRGTLELAGPGKLPAEIKLTRKSLKRADLITATSKVLIESAGPRGTRALYFMPVTMKQSESELIVGLIQSQIMAEGH